MLSVLVGAELQHSGLLPWGGFPISPGAYIFQRPFLRGLCTIRNLVSKSIGLAYSWKEIYRFCFVLLCK